MCKGFFCEARSSLSRTSCGSSALSAKIGSSEFKKSLHFGQNNNLVAHLGGFLRGGTEKAAREGDSVAEKSILEPRSGFEPETPSLPWKCSTS